MMTLRPSDFVDPTTFSMIAEAVRTSTHHNTSVTIHASGALGADIRDMLSQLADVDDGEFFYGDSPAGEWKVALDQR